MGMFDMNLCQTHYGELQEWQNALAAQAEAERGLPEVQTCPRRMDELGPWDRSEGLDSWILRHNYKAVLNRVCGFCGSLHPDDFMDALRSGVQIHGTDKSYKAYLGDDNDKFYYMHLSEDQMAEFIELYNNGKMNVGDYGLYVLPFFCRKERR